MIWKLQGERTNRFDCITGLSLTALTSPWSAHGVFTVHEVSLWGKIRLGGFLWLRQRSLSLLPGWVSIGLQVHTLARRPPVAPTNCSIHSSAGAGRRPLIGYQRRLGNFPTASACWQPASHSSSPPGTHTGEEGADSREQGGWGRGVDSHGPKVHWTDVKVSPKSLRVWEDQSLWNWGEKKNPKSRRETCFSLKTQLWFQKKDAEWKEKSMKVFKKGNIKW